MTEHEALCRCHPALDADGLPAHIDYRCPKHKHLVCDHYTSAEMIEHIMLADKAWPCRRCTRRYDEHESYWRERNALTAEKYVERVKRMNERTKLILMAILTFVAVSAFVWTLR